MKSLCSRQVKCQTGTISQRVEIDASPQSPGSSALDHIPVDVTQQGSRVTGLDAGHVMS